MCDSVTTHWKYWSSVKSIEQNITLRTSRVEAKRVQEHLLRANQVPWVFGYSTSFCHSCQQVQVKPELVFSGLARFETLEFKSGSTFRPSSIDFFTCGFLQKEPLTACLPCLLAYVPIIHVFHFTSRPLPLYSMCYVRSRQATVSGLEKMKFVHDMPPSSSLLSFSQEEEEAMTRTIFRCNGFEFTYYQYGKTLLGGIFYVISESFSVMCVARQTNGWPRNQTWNISLSCHPVFSTFRMLFHWLVIPRFNYLPFTPLVTPCSSISLALIYEKKRWRE